MRNTNKKPEAIRTVGNPVFNYASACCNVVANKPPCLKPATNQTQRFGKQKDFVSLGKWRCTQCSKRCSVTRHRSKP